MTTAQFILSGWTWNPSVLVTGACALVIYVAAFRDRRRIGWFAAALAVFLLTLLSPLNTLADGYLFSAHMAQHILLLLIVPALLLLSLPRTLSLAVGPRVFAHPLVGWLAGVGAMWFWHAPALCNAAVASRPVHALQTVSLLVLGGLFWRQILAPREEDAFRRRARYFICSARASPAACSGLSSRFRRSRFVRFTPCRRTTGSGCCRPFARAGVSRRSETSKSEGCSCGCPCV
jgi:cytochrome c oxidase assembly factor CtaG